nr:RHS repeat-associated core domain-containing protein [Leptolyngbyaceae cyanobacterium MO_188.B28]
YHGARYYAPWLMRWTTKDPIGVTGVLNLYIFVEDSPTKYIDPNGTKIKDFETQLTIEEANNGSCMPDITQSSQSNEIDKLMFLYNGKCNKPADSSKQKSFNRETGFENLIDILNEDNPFLVPILPMGSFSTGVSFVEILNSVMDSPNTVFKLTYQEVTVYGIEWIKLESREQTNLRTYRWISKALEHAWSGNPKSHYELYTKATSWLRNIRNAKQIPIQGQAILAGGDLLALVAAEHYFVAAEEASRKNWFSYQFFLAGLNAYDIAKLNSWRFSKGKWGAVNENRPVSPPSLLVTQWGIMGAQEGYNKSLPLKSPTRPRRQN